MKVSYDPKCEELAARWFLAIEESHTESEVASLAGAIQRAIEDWLDDRAWRRTPTAAGEKE
jgi:hypothetical protein